MAKNNGASRRSKDYEIGKGRPPVNTRWRPGQSGNPRGRPRGSKNLINFLAEALNEKIQIQERGKLRPITAREAIIKRIVNEALKGNLKAANLLLGYEPKIAENAKDQVTYEAERRFERLTPEERTAQAQAVYLRIVKGVG